MTDNGDNWTETVDNFFSETDEEELRTLVSLQDKHDSFEASDLNEDDPINPKTWGLAIENKIIKPHEDGYKLDARSEISQYLSDNWSDSGSEGGTNEETGDSQETELPDVDFDKANWTRKDKLAAAGGFLGILGFSFSPIRDIIYGALSVPLNPLLEVLPFFAVVLVIAVLTSIWSTLVRERIIQVDVSDFREYINQLRDDGGGMFGLPDDATEEEEQQIMQAQQSMMKAQMKPLGWTMIVTIPFVIWIFATSNLGSVGTIVFPLLGEQAWAGTVIGPIRTWIVWYASSTVVLSQIVKRLYDF